MTGFLSPPTLTLPRRKKKQIISTNQKKISHFQVCRAPIPYIPHFRPDLSPVFSSLWFTIRSNSRLSFEFSFYFSVMVRWPSSPLRSFDSILLPFQYLEKAKSKKHQKITIAEKNLFSGMRCANPLPSTLLTWLDQVSPIL